MDTAIEIDRSGDLFYADLWEVWGYPDDPEWDRESYDIGYVTDNGTGTCIAHNLPFEIAQQIVSAVKLYRGVVEENFKLRQLLMRAGVDPSRAMDA